jgi:hypothetical protein
MIKSYKIDEILENILRIEEITTINSNIITNIKNNFNKPIIKTIKHKKLDFKTIDQIFNILDKFPKEMVNSFLTNIYFDNDKDIDNDKDNNKIIMGFPVNNYNITKKEIELNIINNYRIYSKILEFFYKHNIVNYRSKISDKDFYKSSYKFKCKDDLSDTEIYYSYNTNTIRKYVIKINRSGSELYEYINDCEYTPFQFSTSLYHFFSINWGMGRVIDKDIFEYLKTNYELFKNLFEKINYYNIIISEISKVFETSDDSFIFNCSKNSFNYFISKVEDLIVSKELLPLEDVIIVKEV